MQTNLRGEEVMKNFETAVAPAQAGVQVVNQCLTRKTKNWIPAFAGMTVLAFLSMLIAPASLQAAGKGTSGGQFLRVGAGARGPAMAGAFSPIADDATAIYWNPAGMALIEKREVALSYNAYFQDTASQFLGYAQPTDGRGTFGFGASLFGVQDIEKRSATGGDADIADLGDFNTQDMALALGWANKRGALHYGLSLKYISSDLETEKAQTAALDVGTIYKMHEDKGLSLSLAVLNLGGELKFAEEGDPLPLNIKPGLAYRMNTENMGSLTAVVDSDILINDNKAYVQPGVEWRAHPMLALRTGFQIGRGEGAGSGFAAGVGFNIMNLGLDYAFVPYGDLGDSHRVSIGLKF